LIRQAVGRSSITSFVVQSQTTCDRLVERGLPSDLIRVVRPSIDRIWFETGVPSAQRLDARAELGLSPPNFVVGYFGSPKPLRGLPTLLRALATARASLPRLRLLVLSRRRAGELDAEQRAIEALVAQLGVEDWVRMQTGFLPRQELIRTLAVCDAVALPFEIVPSDVPLSVLEAMALGLPVITTQVACLPELVPNGAGLRVPPANPAKLAEAIVELAGHPELRAGLGRAGRQQAERWQRSGQTAAEWDTLLDLPEGRD
jgi:glycosyltransferase involved in cell wall biosynthesis